MKPTRIVTCPNEMRRICENQSHATKEQKARSILMQNGVIGRYEGPPAEVRPIGTHKGPPAEAVPL